MNQYLIFGGLLFAIGLFGALTRTSTAAVLLSIQLMATAAIVTFVTFNHFIVSDGNSGQIFAIVIAVVSAAQLLLGALFVLRTYKKESLAALNMIKRRWLLLVIGVSLIGLYKLETDPSRERVWPLLTLVSALGLIVMALASRHSPSKREEQTPSEPPATSKEEMTSV
ncbi:MAG: NADH-quinone oxidoreductase subunit K [candidate division Zixibacteria bacterium]|nr:NADH-quinone oxidoreductase subunit K [candidate division Zixibacteria bacterium]